MRRVRPGIVLVLLVGIALLAAAAACSPTPPSSAPSGAGASPTSPGQAPAKSAASPAGKTNIVIARQFDVKGLDPGFLTENAQVVDNIFDRLVMRDANMQLQPGLALSWKTIDELTWEFKLRQGVKFHNGETFDANAVKFSIDRVLDPAKKSPTLSYISTVSKVEVVDPSTVRIITQKPDPLIPVRFNRYPTEVVPPKYVQEKGDAYFASNPVGTGPYKFVEWVKDERVVLEANDAYWGGAPAVKKVTWRPIPEDSTRVSALLAGEVDVAAALPVQEFKRVQDSKNSRVSIAKGGGLIVYIGLKTDEKPFSDVRVRQALNYAVDKEAIVNKILEGKVTRTNSLYGPSDFGFQGEPKGFDYDPAKAKQLLAEAGYPNGFETSLDAVNWYIRCEDVAQAVAAQLAQVGVKVKVNVVESSVYRTSVPNKKQSPMYFLGWGSTNSLDADAAAYAVLHSGESYSTYSNPAMDALLDKGRSSTDPEVRKQAYKQVQDLAMQEAPRIFMYQEDKYVGVSNQLKWDARIDDAIPVATMTFNP